jgi:hypothetical protein
MNPLEELQARVIPVTWATIAMGLEGPGSAPPQIDLSDVRSWLDAALSHGRELQRAVDLLVAIDNDAQARRLISELGARSADVPDPELRKWQSVMLKRELAHLPQEPFYAALALADFWSQFGDDPELPRPSGQKLVSPLTEDDRQRLVDDQRRWLAKTLESLASRP